MLGQRGLQRRSIAVAPDQPGQGNGQIVLICWNGADRWELPPQTGCNKLEEPHGPLEVPYPVAAQCGQSHIPRAILARCLLGEDDLSAVRHRRHPRSLMHCECDVLGPDRRRQPHMHAHPNSDPNTLGPAL